MKYKIKLFFLKLYYRIFSRYDLCMHCKYTHYGMDEYPCNKCRKFNLWKEYEQ